jgi:nucleoporin SEH1
VFFFWLWWPGSLPDSCSVSLLNRTTHEQAHVGSIWKVVWAHPEFGQVIASCSFDKTICIWHEQSGMSASLSQHATFEQAHARRCHPHNSHGPLAFSIAHSTSHRSSPVFAGLVDSLGKSRWVLVATLSDSRDSVTDIKFSPKHLGLKLVCGSWALVCRCRLTCYLRFVSCRVCLLDL